METRLIRVPWWDAALCHLRADSRLAPLIEKSEGEGLEACTDFFSSMVRAVCGQQVSNAADAKAQERVLKAAIEIAPDNLPFSITKLGNEGLTALGLSATKRAALLGLADGYRTGELAQSTLGALTDAQVLARLTQIRGVGPWTAHMILIFGLNRPDVFPVGDYGLKVAGIKLFGNLDTMLRISQAWSPYRTAATWLIWHDRSGSTVRY